MANERLTYRTNFNERDVTSSITNVSPTETPFFSLIGNKKATSRKIESLTDSNAAANADNALVEGGSLENTVTNDRGVETNWTQIFRKVIEVSGTQEVVMKYGDIKSEMKYQLTKAHKEIATDVEKALITQTVATGDDSTARTLDGAIAKISTNALTEDITGNTWVGESEADLVAFEEKFNDMFQTAFDNGGSLTHVFVGGKLKRRISKLSQKVTRNTDAEKKTQILVINNYDSDFGNMSIVLNRYVPDSTILAVNINSWKVAYLRSFSQFELAKTADSKRWAIVGELSLHCDTEKDGAKIVAS